MTVLVADTSAIVEFLLATEKGEQVRTRIRAGTLHIPHICSVEVISAVRGLVRAKEVKGERAEGALDDLAALAAVRHPAERLLPRIWQLRHNLTAYDATYVALAEALEAPLVTVDEKLNTRSVRKLITVELIR